MPTPSPARLLTRRRVLAALCLVVAVGAVLLWRAHHRPAPAGHVALPSEFAAPRWERMLAGDRRLTSAAYTELNGYHPGLDADQAQRVADIAAPLVEADLTGSGRDRWPQYWPPAATTTTAPPVRCATVRPLAVSAAVFPVAGPADPGSVWVKALVAYRGRCGTDRYTTGSPGVEYVYLLATDATTFTPVREWDVPQDDPDRGVAQVADWQLAPITGCPSGDGTVQRLRTFAAEAMGQMCAAAKADGVVLVTDSAYRDRAAQAALFEKAVRYYGSQAEARKWVAYADSSVCESKHCTGTAVNVEPDHAATTWLWDVVGCARDGVVTRAEQCPDDASVVRRAQTYGFVLPYERIPGYMEFVLPTDDTTTAPADCSPDGVGVDVMVASVFRCRLGRAGVPAAETEHVVAQALVVAKCTSEWNPAAQVFAGRYVTDPNPVDGRVYSETGVFGLRRELVDAGWVPGPVTDPVANINAAASLWLATRGWEQFACATGTDPGLRAGPVLPEYGGPQIPAWATRY